MAWRNELDIHPACNLLPRMTAEELQGLSDDIRRNRLQERAKVIRAGERYQVIDGQSRLDALEKIAPIQVFVDGKPNSKFFDVIDLQGRSPLALVLSWNIQRRHLNTEGKRKLITNVVKAHPELSDNAIATMVNADHKTVGSVRAEMVGRREIPNVKTRTDSKGRKQPAHKQKRQVASLKSNQPAAVDRAPQDVTPDQPVVSPPQDTQPVAGADDDLSHDVSSGETEQPSPESVAEPAWEDEQPESNHITPSALDRPSSPPPLPRRSNPAVDVEGIIERSVLMVRASASNANFLPQERRAEFFARLRGEIDDVETTLARVGGEDTEEEHTVDKSEAPEPSPSTQLNDAPVIAAAAAPTIPALDVADDGLSIPKFLRREKADVTVPRPPAG